LTALLTGNWLLPDPGSRQQPTRPCSTGCCATWSAPTWRSVSA
jgi:hypothetical protein